MRENKLESPYLTISFDLEAVRNRESHELLKVLLLVCPDVPVLHCTCQFLIKSYIIQNTSWYSLSFHWEN